MEEIKEMFKSGLFITVIFFIYSFEFFGLLGEYNKEWYVGLIIIGAVGLALIWFLYNSVFVFIGLWAKLIDDFCEGEKQ